MSTPPKPLFLGAALKQVRLNTHAAIVLLGAAIADQQIQDAILTKMKKLSRKLEDELFTAYGPLSSLSAKTAVAYALDILDTTTYKASHTQIEQEGCAGCLTLSIGGTSHGPRPPAAPHV
jgi:hypothetical protein